MGFRAEDGPILPFTVDGTKVASCWKGPPVWGGGAPLLACFSSGSPVAVTLAAVCFQSELGKHCATSAVLDTAHCSINTLNLQDVCRADLPDRPPTVQKTRNV